MFGVVALLPCAIDAATPPAPPGAGTFLQDLKPRLPPAPESDQPQLQIEQQGDTAAPPSAPLSVRSIRITGNRSFDSSTLHALIAGAEGQDLTLPELEGWIARITDFYHAHGYPLARAIIPPQTIRDGLVTIELIEARYGKIVLDNHSGASNGLLLATLEPLQSNSAISSADIDHALFLLGSIPGIKTSATLKPGEISGTSDLLVQGEPGIKVFGSVTADNYGNRYTGRVRAGGEIAVNEPLHQGDVLDASVLTSGKNLNYGRLTYDSVINGVGSHFGASYSRLHYALGESLAVLEGHGTADVKSVWAEQPLLRRVDADIYVQLQFERKILRDELDVAGIHTHRHLDDWVASMTGDERDALLSGGSTTWSAGLISGRLGFDDANAALADASANTRGAFLQGNAMLSRLQRLTAATSLYLSASWQWANSNLDASQKMVAGGPYTVRSYDMSALSGDRGVQATFEWRRDLPGWFGQWQALAFVDTEHLTINKNIFTAGSNTATISGGGLGLNWAGPYQWSAQGSVASRIGPTPEVGGAISSVRAWLSIGRGF